MRVNSLLSMLLITSACSSTTGKSSTDTAAGADSGTASADGADGDSGAEDDVLELEGALDCDGCGTVIIAAFDNPDLAGAPLLDTVVDAADPFSLSISEAPAAVWLLAFDDANGNHAPDPGEATGAAGPFSEDADDILIEMSGGGGGGGGDTVTLSGTLSCFEGCHPPFVVGIMAADDTEWTPVGIVEEPGPYSIEVPAGLGVVDLIAVEDLNGSRDYEPPEELGAIEDVTIGDEDLEGLDIEVLLEETWILSPGVEDELGLPVAVQELILLLDGSRTGSEVAAELGAHVRHDIDGVGIVVETGITADDPDPLAALASLETTAQGLRGVEAVLRSAYVTTSEARETDDNASLAAGLDWAFGLLRVADAKDQLHDCAIHLDSSARSLSVQVGIVDFDLQGVRDASEFAGVVGSFTDHHTADENDVETHGAHGSMVASLLGARNDGTGMNGLLEGFTGTAADGSAYDLSHSLHLHNIGQQSRESDGSGGTVMRTNTTSGALLAGIAAAMAGPSTVVNASVGSYAGSLGHLRYIRGLRASIEKVLDQNSSTVLVLSAGNDNRDIGKGFHLSSMDKTNLIVVGATTDTDARASFSNYGRHVDLAAPGLGVYGFRQEVDHEGTSTSLGDSSYGPISGTSFAAPITAANVALIQAFDGTASPATVLARLQRAADPVTAELGSHRVHTRRTVQFQIEQHLNTTTEWLLDFEAELTSISGDGCAAALSPTAAAQCMPMVPSGGGHALATGITDILGNAQTMELALGGTASGSGVSLLVDGQGTSFGVGPATATYTGTVGTDPHDPVPVPGDLYVSGTFSGSTPSHPDLNCTYSGTWEGWLRRSTP